MRGSKNKAQQYGGEHTLLNKKEIYSIPNSLANFAIRLDPHMRTFHNGSRPYVSD